MRKYGKIVLSLLLSLTVICSLIPTTFARTWSDVDTFEKEIDMMTGLGFMDGENSKQFFPDDYIDNAELVRILMQVRGITEGDGVRRFQDVPTTYYAFDEIDAAFKLGYITVPADKMFYPEEKATADRALEILLGMLNYNTYRQAATETLRQTASRAGLTDGLHLGTYITKGELAKLIYNSFSCGMMEASGVQGVNTVYKVNAEKTTLSFHNWEMITGNVTGNERSSLYYSGNPAGDGKVRIDTDFYLEGDSYAGDLLGYNVDAVITKETSGFPTIIYAAAERKADVLTVAAEDIDSVSGMTFNYMDNKHLNLRADMMIVYNGLAVPFDANLLDIEYGEVTFVSTSGGKKYDIVLVNEYQSFVISSVASAEKRIYFKRGTVDGQPYVSYEDNIYQDVVIKKNGVRATEADLVAESAVAVYFADAERDLITLEVATSNTSGTISSSGVAELTGRKMMVLGTEEYLISPNVYGEEFIKLGQGAEVTLDFNNYVVQVKQATVTSNYGVVTWVGYDDLEEEALVKIFKADGKFETFKTQKEEIKFVLGTTVERVTATNCKERLEGILRSDIIMYGTNSEGKLNKITQATAHDFSNELNNQGKFTLYKNYTSGVSNNYWYIDGIAYGNTKTFMIPTDSDYADKDCRVVTGGFSADNGTTSNFKFYNVGLNGRAELALRRSTQGAEIPSWENNIFLVQKIIETINSDDEPVTAVVGYSGGQKMTLEFAKDAQNQSSATGCTTLTPAQLGFGDILNYGTNSNGEISAYAVVYSDRINKASLGCIFSGGNGYNQTRTLSINHGFAKYYADDSLSLEVADNGMLSIGLSKNSQILKLSRSDKTVETASIGDIRYKNFYTNTKGSEMIVRTNRGGSQEVFIYED
ncbi:MAG: S-layer homology domain-containing protein [Clostridia bacterium]|nr:S-layer homology domain-containing protein [Clostridia bacterium]